MRHAWRRADNTVTRSARTSQRRRGVRSAAAARIRTGGRGEEPPPLRFVGDWKKESLFVGARREKATASRCPSLDTARAASASILQRLQ